MPASSQAETIILRFAHERFPGLSVLADPKAKICALGIIPTGVRNCGASVFSALVIRENVHRVEA